MIGYTPDRDYQYIRINQFLRRMHTCRKEELTANMLVRTYRQEVEQQTMLIKKAKLCEARLIFIVSALGELFRDEHFFTLLRAEAIDSMPKYLANHIKERQRGGSHEKGG